jgi:hypothetical protein
LLELARYLVLNPLRAHLVASAGDYPRSSYRAMTRDDAPPRVVGEAGDSCHVRPDRGASHRELPELRRCGHRRAVTLGEPQTARLPRHRHVCRVMQSRVPLRQDLREMPQARGRPIPRPLHDYDQAHAERNEAIKAAYASGGYRMREIGDYFGLHLSRASRIVRGQSRDGAATEATVKA